MNKEHFAWVEHWKESKQTGPNSFSVNWVSKITYNKKQPKQRRQKDYWI